MDKKIIVWESLHTNCPTITISWPWESMMTAFIFSTPSHGNPFANLKSHKNSTYQKPFSTNNKVNSSISFEKESISCPRKDKPKILKIMEFPVSV
jgi:hypothetical protein